MMGAVKRGTWTPATRIAVAAVIALVAAGVVMIVLLTGGSPPTAQPAPPAASSPTASGAPSAGPLPGATPTTGSEVTPPATGSPSLPRPTTPPNAGQPPQTGPGTAPAPRDADRPLVAAPLPPPGSRTGGLVAGYPARIVGPLNGSDVVSSSISTEGTVMQLSLVATSSASADAVRAHYRDLWRSLGLKDRKAGDGTVTYAGAYESLSLSVGASGTGNRYTIYGVFRTE